MPIEALTKVQLADNIRRLRAAGVTQGRPYSLAQLLAEEHRRQPASAISTVACAQAILSLSKAASNGLIFYGDVWNAFYPDQKWSAHKSLAIVTNALERVGYYCIRHGLPLIVTLVVNKTAGGLTEAAKDNIFDAWVERGAGTQLPRDEWIDEQQTQSLALSPDALPSET